MIFRSIDFSLHRRFALAMPIVCAECTPHPLSQAGSFAELLMDRLPHLSRFILPSCVSGNEIPSTVRSLACQARVSSSTGPMMLVALIRLLSLRVVVVLMIHRFPSLVQLP